MMRDRLELAQGDLAESKNRIMELEDIQVHNIKALQSCAQQLDDSGQCSPSAAWVPALMSMIRKESYRTHFAT